jgi:DoxX-like protein
MNTDSPSPNRTRFIVGNILIYLGAFGLFAGGVAKFAHVPKVVEQLTSMGLGGSKLTLVASLEILSAVLLAFRPVRSVGILFLSAYLGGAVCAHVRHGAIVAVNPPAIVLAICWLGVFLRHPQSLWSLSENSTSPKQYAVADRRQAVHGEI